MVVEARDHNSPNGQAAIRPNDRRSIHARWRRMGHLPLLDELTVIAGLGVVVTVILARLRLPAVAGLLLVGALLGPHGFGLVRSRNAIETLAELGVVMLL